MLIAFLPYASDEVQFDSMNDPLKRKATSTTGAPSVSSAQDHFRREMGRECREY